MKLMLAALAVPIAMLAACTTTPSGATCPTDNAPTYASFGRTFFTTYCTGCHSASATDRHNAPAGVNYDTEADIKAGAADIDALAAAGPNATNTTMPDLSATVKTPPSQSDRLLLGQFLACEKASPGQ